MVLFPPDPRTFFDRKSPAASTDISENPPQKLHPKTPGHCHELIDCSADMSMEWQTDPPPLFLTYDFALEIYLSAGIINIKS